MQGLGDENPSIMISLLDWISYSASGKILKCKEKTMFILES